MRFVRLFLAALFSSIAVYLLLLGGEGRADVLTAIGIEIKHNVAMVLCVQGLVVGLILGVQSILEQPSVRTN